MRGSARWWRAWLVPALLLVAVPMAAQSPTDRQMLAAWEDSLLAARSPSDLAGWNRLAGGSTPAGPLRQALFRLRRAQLAGDASDVDRSIEALLLEAASHPDWPWPHLALARTFTWLHGQRFARRTWTGVPDGATMATMAWRHLLLMQTRDAAFGRGEAYLFQVLLAQGDRELTAEQFDVMQRAMEQSTPRPEARLVWARERRARGALEEALALLHGLRGTWDASTIALELARTARALGDTARARDAYWAGLDDLSPAGRALYRYDLEWILSEAELLAFDRLQDEAVADWLRRWWARQDALAANQPGAALHDHLARWETALRLFRVTESIGRLTADERLPAAERGVCEGDEPLQAWRLRQPQPSLPGDVRGGDPLFDSRGVAFLRHGSPLGFARTLGGPVEPDIAQLDVLMGESPVWRYLDRGRDRSLLFSPATGQGLSGAAFLTSGLLTERPMWFEAASPTGEATVDRNRARCPPPTLAAGRDRQSATTPDLNRVVPRIRTLWEGTSSAALIGSADRAHRVLVTWAIAARHVRPVAGPGGERVWPLRFRLVARDSVTGREVVLDTLVQVTDPPTTATRGHLTGWFEVVLPNGEWTLAMRGDQGRPDEALYLVHPPLHLAPHQGPGMTDILLGADGGRLWSAPDGRGFPLHPLGAWGREDPIPIYFAVDGLIPGEAVEVTLQVTALGLPGSPPVVLGLPSFPASGDRTVVRRSVVLDSPLPGPYRLNILLRAGGYAVEHSVVFHVLPW